MLVALMVTSDRQVSNDNMEISSRRVNILFVFSWQAPLRMASGGAIVCNINMCVCVIVCVYVCVCVLCCALSL